MHNRHHLTPRSRFRKGTSGDVKNTKQNLLTIKIDRHNYWHRIFGNRTLEEVIQLLHRLKRMKGRSKTYEDWESKYLTNKSNRFWSD